MTEQSLPEQDGASLLGILDELTEIVLGAKPVPMSASVRVNRAELLALLESAKNVVPTSISTAEAIVAEARAEAARLADQANSYCDDRLAAFEADLATLAKQVAGGREAVAQRRATAAEDLEKAHAAAAEARRRGTEEDPARQGARPGADDSHPDTHPEDPEHR